MREQLELIARTDQRPGCHFSQSILADSWFVNLHITENEKCTFVYCDQCSRPTCYRFKYGRRAYIAAGAD
jgi:hypothetical protein